MQDIIPITPIDALPMVQALRESGWLAAMRAVHLLGVSLLVGGVLLFDLRVLGLARALPLRALAAHLLPFAVLGFALAAGSGLLLFATRASELLGSGVFLAKLCLIFLMGINAVAFHMGPWRHADDWHDTGVPTLARLLIAASALGWIGVLACGAILGG